MSYIISRLGIKDAPSAASVMSQFGRHLPPVEGLRSFLASNSHIFVVASAGDAIVGFAYAYDLQRPDGDTMLFLYSIDVAPEHRRRGVATALIRSLLQFGADRGSGKMFVLTPRSNEAAIALYRSAGGTPSNADTLLFEYPITKNTHLSH
jgi:ribosomal protein S18 acetylase RimI-like enzyme